MYRLFYFLVIMLIRKTKKNIQYHLARFNYFDDITYMYSTDRILKQQDKVVLLDLIIKLMTLLKYAKLIRFTQRIVSHPPRPLTLFPKRAMALPHAVFSKRNNLTRFKFLRTKACTRLIKLSIIHRKITYIETIFLYNSCT